MSTESEPHTTTSVDQAHVWRSSEGSEQDCSDAAGPGLTVTVTGVTHRGLKRTSNQDVGGAAGWLLADGDRATMLGPLASPVTIVVADGAGGHPAGDVASRLVASHVLALGREADSAEKLLALIASAHRALHDRMLEEPATRGMATTVAIMTVTERSVGSATWVTAASMRSVLTFVRF